MALLCGYIRIFIFMSHSWALGCESKVNTLRGEKRQVLSEICHSEGQGLETPVLGPSVYVGGEEEGAPNDTHYEAG